MVGGVRARIRGDDMAFKCPTIGHRWPVDAICASPWGIDHPGTQTRAHGQIWEFPRSLIYLGKEKARKVSPPGRSVLAYFRNWLFFHRYIRRFDDHGKLWFDRINRFQQIGNSCVFCGVNAAPFPLTVDHRHENPLVFAVVITFRFDCREHI